MTLNRKILFYGSSLAFIGLNSFLFIKEFYWLALLPALIMVLWLMVYHTEKVLLFVALATPLSQKVDFTQFGLSISLPTEPLMILFMGFMALKVFLTGEYDRRVFRHPVTIAIIINLAWILITSFTSSMPIVSLKFFTARLWFITSFYFGGVLLFKRYGNIKAFAWLFSISLVVAIIYTLSRMASHGFDQHFSNKAAAPLFSDHGVYAAVISLFIPMLALFFFRGKMLQLSLWQQFFALVILVMLLAGVVFSFTRAAWIGLAASAAMYVIIYLRIRFSTLLITAVLLGSVFWYFKTDIYFKLKSNKQVSASDLEAHLQSISNISTDVSNTERINRWESAYRMFQEHPVVGWGPGTYMFQYAPFQRSDQMTLISTNSGMLGNAHSEYIGPLAESGILGLLSTVFLFLTSIYCGMRIVYRSKEKVVRTFALAVVLGLTTYYVHGFLNDYLDVDKAAVPFWAFMAILAVLDLYHDNEARQPENENISLPAEL